MSIVRLVNEWKGGGVSRFLHSQNLSQLLIQITERQTNISALTHSNHRTAGKYIWWRESQTLLIVYESGVGQVERLGFETGDLISDIAMITGIQGNYWRHSSIRARKRHERRASFHTLHHRRLQESFALRGASESVILDWKIFITFLVELLNPVPKSNTLASLTEKGHLNNYLNERECCLIINK